MADILTAMTGTVTAVARVNVRQGAPSTAATIARRLEKGASFDIIGLVAGQAVAGHDDWYVGAPTRPDGPNEYVWAGGVRAPDAGFVGDSSAIPGRRRADGTLKVLSNAELEQLYGKFSWSEGVGGAVVPDPAWGRANIVKLAWPNICGGAGATLWIHRKAKPHFQAVIDSIAAAGLASTILTNGGTYVPRHMGWTVGRPLSSHSWGVAIDINVAWNPYGGAPAPLGAVGSVRQLVSLFEAQGFAWGGRFAPDNLRDGMHFELARTDV